MKKVIAFAAKHKFIFAYTICLTVLPIVSSSIVIYTLTQYSFFFRSLHWLDLSLVFLIFSIMMAFALIPTTFVCFLSGFLWEWKSVMYILPAYLVAQTIGYYLARWIDGDKLIHALKSGGKLPRTLTNIQKKQGLVIFLSRLSPVLPFAVMNVVLSILQTDFRKFSVYGFCGMVPRTLLVIWLGTQTKDLSQNLHDHIGYKCGLLLFTVITIVGIGKIASYKRKSPAEQGLGNH